MKHIIYIHIIVIVFSAVCAYFLFYESPKPSDPYITVNDKVISKNEFNRTLKEKPYYSDGEEFLEQFIEKELLIQEAIKNKLHHNKEFKQRIKSFYEKNLVQLLMVNKYDQFEKMEISEKVINRYIKYLSLKVKIENTDKTDFKNFEFIPPVIKYKMVFNNNKSVEYNENNSSVKYSLTESEVSENSEPPSRNEVAKELKIIRSKVLWDKWIKDLKENAEIKILQKN